MKRIWSLLVCLLLFGFYAAFGQDIQIKGTVTAAEDGSSLPGVYVLIKGTNNGTATDATGQYQVTAPSNATLVFSSVGYKTQEIVLAGQSQLDVLMALDVTEVDEIVVTAIGMTRAKKALGYAVQQVNGADLAQAKETNVINSLQGRVAGALVTSSSGAVGASSRIVLRGVNFVGGNNQPLFVVDGVPISNASFGGTDNEGVNRGNGAGDINPDDVESFSVLKGPNAAALYGSRASNGVILVTTKSGKDRKGLGVSFTNTTTWEKPLKIPDFQNKYGQGSGGQFAFYDGAGGGIADGTDESWGPQLDIGLMIPQFNSPIDPETGERIPTPWVSHPDNVKDFYETGRTVTNNIALTGGSENMHFRVSFTNLNQKGMVPNTDYKRNTISVAGSTDLSKKLNVSASFSYVNTKSDNMPGYGYDAQNVVQQQMWFGRQVDIAALRDYTNPELGFSYADVPLTAGKGIQGYKYNWNYNYHNNPYFTLYENLNSVNRERFFGNAKAVYKITDWLSAMIRTGGDISSNLNTGRVAQGDVDNSYGSYSEDATVRKEINTDFLLTFIKNIGSSFSVLVNVGGNNMYSTYQNNYAAANELAINGVYNVENSRVPLVTSNYSWKKSINSIYGAANIGYKNVVFLDATLRNDWSSTLPKENNSYLYPSISLSSVLTDLFQIESKILNFAKVRVSWSKVGSDTDPFQLLPYAEFGDGWNASTKLLNLYVPNTLPNGKLEPQMVTSTELGGEFIFLDSRIRLDLTYYNSRADNQIFLGLPISAASGYAGMNVNAGAMTNKGIEIQLTLTPVKLTNSLKWDILFNFALNKNIVEELPEGIDSYQLGTYWDMKLLALEGEKYGSFFGYDFERDSHGNVIHENGLPVQGDLKFLGSYTPDWTAGINNSFSYKGFTANILIDFRTGGELYSMTTTWGRYAGILEESLIGREGGIVGKGVKAVDDGSGTIRYEPNDVVVTAEDYNKNAFSNTLQSSSVFNASFIKLREIGIGYTFKKVGNLPIKDLRVSVVGRNLALLKSHVPHVDPETAFSSGNVQGFEFGQLPSARSIGFSINLGL
jgi:TonB-linked SusC/RagA family outer membrane protein